MCAAAIRALSGLNRQDACRRLYEVWERSAPWYRQAVLQGSQESPAAQRALVDALEAGTVVPLELPVEVDAALRGVKGELESRARAVLASPGAADRARVVGIESPTLMLSSTLRLNAEDQIVRCGIDSARAIPLKCYENQNGVAQSPVSRFRSNTNEDKIERTSG